MAIDTVCVGIIINLCFNNPGAEVPKPPVVIVAKGCPKPKNWSKEWQQGLAKERRALAPESIARQALDEWLSLRDQSRKCRGAK